MAQKAPTTTTEVVKAIEIVDEKQATATGTSRLKSRRSSALICTKAKGIGTSLSLMAVLYAAMPASIV